MPALSVIADGDGCWPDLEPSGPVKWKEGELQGVALLMGGTVSGKPTVSFRVNMPDGTVVWTQTTLALLEMAVKAFLAREGAIADGTLPDPRKG